MTELASDADTLPPLDDDYAFPEPEPPQPVRQRRRIGTLLRDYGPAFVVFWMFIGLWYLVSYVILPENKQFLVPPPHDVIKVAFLDADNRAELVEGFVNTAQTALWGFLIASLIALVGSVVMALNRTIERALFPWAVVLQTIPVLALVPLFVAWFGPTRTSRIATCVLVALFPILTNFLFGLKSVDRGLLDLFTLNKAGMVTRLTKLQMPAALPSIFTGLRIGAGLCVIGALVADFFFTRGDLGLGRLINNYAKQLEYERLFGAVIMAATLGVAIYALIGWLGNRTLRNWHESEAKAA
jgi:NitT/TauT family transport system permease protein